MKQNLRLGRVAGIPIGLQWSALVIVALIALTLATGVLPSAAPGRSALVYWAVAVPAAAVFLACLLAHELAHSLVAQRKGVRVRSITLWMLGGISELEDEAPDPKADLAIAAAGPLTSFALGAAFIVAYPIAAALGTPPLFTQTLVWLGLVNVVLAVLNLLPGAPLDGGRVLRAILWRRYHDRARADLAAAHAGRTLGLTFVGVGLVEVLFMGAGNGLWLMLIGWFLVAAANAEATTRMAHEALSGIRVGEIMTPQPDCAQAWHDVETFVRQTLVASRQDVFPVLEFDGRPTGVVTVGQIARIPLEQRQNLLVRSIAIPLPEENVCGPDDPAAELLAKRPVAGQLVAVVVDGHRVVGMITTADLTRIVVRGLLRTPPLPAPVPDPPVALTTPNDGHPLDRTSPRVTALERRPCQRATGRRPGCGTMVTARRTPCPPTSRSSTSRTPTTMRLSLRPRPNSGWTALLLIWVSFC